VVKKDQKVARQSLYAAPFCTVHCTSKKGCPLGDFCVGSHPAVNAPICVEVTKSFKNAGMKEEWFTLMEVAAHKNALNFALTRDELKHIKGMSHEEAVTAWKKLHPKPPTLVDLNKTNSKQGALFDSTRFIYPYSRKWIIDQRDKATDIKEKEFFKTLLQIDETELPLMKPVFEKAYKDHAKDHAPGASF